MTLSERLEKADKAYREAKAATGGGASLPKGKMQFTIAKVSFIPESKLPFILGQMQIGLQCQVLTGSNKSRIGFMNFYIEQPATDTHPSGMDQFKALAEGLGIAVRIDTTANLKKTLKELSGLRFLGYSTGKRSTVYFNGPMDVEDDELDDDEGTTSEETPLPKISARKKITVGEPDPIIDDATGDEEDDWGGLD